MRLPAFLKNHGRVLGSFGAMQAMQLILPLIALPWLARMLGPDAFGILMYLLLIPPLAALFIDWGLGLGGARAAAPKRGDAQELARLLGAVLSAKLILGAAVGLIAVVAWPFVPYAREYPGPYCLAFLVGVARGMSPAWLFQGAGYGMPRMAAFDVGASCAVLILTFAFIREAADWPLYLVFILACKGSAYGWIFAGLWRKYAPKLSLRAGWNMLRACAALSGSAFSLLAAYNGGQMILGLYLGAADMGMLAACAKMLRALASLINPFTQTIYPEICIWRGCDPARARATLRRSLALTAVCACACAALAALLAPWLIAIGLGDRYAQATTVLRLMLLAAPLMAVNNVFSWQALAPFGRERAQLAAQAGSALLAWPLAAFLCQRWGLLGGALFPAILELLACAGFVLAICLRCPEAFRAPDAAR